MQRVSDAILILEITMKKYILFSMLLAGAVPAAAAMDSDDAYVDSVCRQFDLNEVVVTGDRKSVV